MANSDSPQAATPPLSSSALAGLVRLLGKQAAADWLAKGKAASLPEEAPVVDAGE